ncbi:MAG: hypothetical protein ACRDVM_07700, partial [Acidimicrobiia bacterium]
MLAPDLVAALVASPTRAEQLAEARRVGIVDDDGLTSLLAAADELLRSDPTASRQLAELCSELAERASLPAIHYRALYLLAQVHSTIGQHERARDLIKTARAGLTSVGLHLDALRTNVGLMHVLNQLGRHEEALAAGRRVLEALAADRKLAATPESQQLVGMVEQNRAVCFERLGRY